MRTILPNGTVIRYDWSGRVVTGVVLNNQFHLIEGDYINSRWELISITNRHRSVVPPEEWSDEIAAAVATALLTGEAP